MKKRQTLPNANQKRAVLSLDSAEQQKWLREHLPSRICAAWVRLPVSSGEWRWTRERELGDEDFANVDPIEIWCICRAVEHGRKAAMRWLIGFVGISLNSNGTPDRPMIYENDVSIQSFLPGGSSDDLRVNLDLANQGSNAWVLAKVWKACSQNSLHSTDRTNHPPDDPPALAKAFSIVVGHLQAKLYEPRREQLIGIVREQRQLLGAHRAC